MKFRKFSVKDSYILRCEKGEDLYETLSNFVLSENIALGFFQAIGAVCKGKLGIFEHGEYRWEEKEGNFEIASCNGNIAVKDDKPFVHCHTVLSDPSGTIFGGHLAPGNIVNPTAEVHVVSFEGDVSRFYDENTGLWLLNI